MGAGLALRSRPSPQLSFQHALQPARVHARRADHLRIDDDGLERLFGPHEPDAGASTEPQTETVGQVVKHLDQRLEVDTRLFLATIRSPGCTPAETKSATPPQSSKARLVHARINVCVRARVPAGPAAGNENLRPRYFLRRQGPSLA